MAIPITIPRLGWNMDEGVFNGWLKQDGDHVHAGEMLFSLTSDKATEEIESFDEGILRIAPAAPKVGDPVVVGAVIGYLLEENEKAPFSGFVSQGSAASQGSAVSQGSQSLTLGFTSDALPGLKPSNLNPGGVSPVKPRVRLCEPWEKASEPWEKTISPRARKAAQDLGIDWTTLHGSGRTGRIRERDVRAAAPNVASSLPHTAIRKIIAERMKAGQLAAAAVTLTTTADATALVKLRDEFKKAAKPYPSYTDFLVKLAGSALQQHPLLNARWSDERIVLSSGIHIGIAVDTDAGLLAPVIRDVAALSLDEVAARARELIARARDGSLTTAEMQGGTFTVTNLGAFGIDAFTPIINPPQCAILGVGRIQRQPVVEDEQIVIRDRISLSLTFDHRIVDGAPAARFLQTLCGLIENPAVCLIDGVHS